MVHLLLAIIYISFISLGLPDALLGAAWPIMSEQFAVPLSYAGAISVIVSMGTITSSLLSDRLTLRFGAGKVTAYLGSWLKENYDLPDHRGEAGYDHWNENLVKYEERLEELGLK